MSQFNLLNLWKKSVSRVGPAALFAGRSCLEEGEALLWWGKAAQHGCRTKHRLVISPGGENDFHCIVGNHPLPGKESFRAGEILLQFFDSLNRFEIRKLRVVLSGGASSLAWIKPSGISEAQLRERLRYLYSSPLTIEKLNQERAQLCGLKKGGAARWLKRLAPRVQVEVEVISDVAPFGPDVVGSGPFWNGKISHKVLADNRSLVRVTKEIAQAHRWKVLSAQAAVLGRWQDWVKMISLKIKLALGRNETGLLIWGGEPQIQLGKKVGQGGRQTQIAAALLLKWADAIAAGKVEIFCASTDGSDGCSRAAGAWISSVVAKNSLNYRAKTQLEKAVREFDTARVLRKNGALIPEFSTGTNVQDLILVRVQSRHK